MCMNLVAQLTPVIERTSEFKSFKILNCAIHGDPGHHFGMNELLSSSTDFPDALIGLHPDLLEMRYPFSFDRSALLRHAKSVLPGLMHRIGDFAVDIQLKLG